jgi:hypothetical protein
MRNPEYSFSCKCGSRATGDNYPLLFGCQWFDRHGNEHWDGRHDWKKRPYDHKKSRPEGRPLKSLMSISIAFFWSYLSLAMHRLLLSALHQVHQLSQPASGE